MLNVENPILVARGIKRCFPMPGGEPFYALKGVDIAAPRGRLTILKGKSGSGKTTLMNILGALDQPTEGTVEFDGREITSMSEKELTRLRRFEIGFVFQSVALIPIMTALENVEFVLRLGRYPGDRRARAIECLEMVGLAERESHMPAQMSGGEQQRVAIARAIAHQPKLIFADEPTGALDTNTAINVVKIFKELCAAQGVSIVMTTHDTGFMEIGDAVYELEGGEVISEH